MTTKRRNKSEEDIKEVLNVFEENKHELVIDGKLQSRNLPIWNRLSDNLNNIYSPLALFTVAAKNYYNSKIILGLEDHVISEDSIADVSDSCESLESDRSSREVNINKKYLEVDIILTFKEYQELNRHTEIYDRKDRYEKTHRSRKSMKRKYDVFDQRHWSHILSKKIEIALHGCGNKCIIAFKKNKIFVNHETKFAEFRGNCRQCNAKLTGYIDSPPRDGENVIICFVLQDFKEHEKTTIKRPLSGKARKEVGEHLAKTNIAPSHYRKILAAKDIGPGLDEPSWIPNVTTLRVAKNEIIKKDRLANDPVYSICQMKVDPSMKGAIQNIGIDPFFVYFWTNTQLHVYNRYCETEHSKLSIDATGSIVKKITRITGEKSKHIFLYDCTVLSRKTCRDNQYSVCNMLSESQNAVSIYSWLAHWIRAGAAIPKEVVTDMSLALMYAVTMAFTSCKSLEEYLEICFNSVFDNQPFTEKCFIRLDVAHLIKLVSQWRSIKKQHRLTRQFYLKSMGQLIQSTDIADVEAIIRSLFTVALSDTEGISIITGNQTTCEKMKEWLKRRASTGSIQQLIEPYFTNQENEYTQFEETATSLLNGSANSPFLKWANNIANECKLRVNSSTEEGDRGNQQCVPALVEDLVKLCRYLPLWSGLMIKYFPSADIIASSASVESNINDIKNRIFGNLTLPLRVDDFLKSFILATDGANKLANSAMDDNDKERQQEDIENSGHHTKASSKNLGSTQILKNDKGQLVLEDLSKQKIFCPSCQLKQSYTDICCNCLKNVHRNKLCSLKRENQLLCLSCSQMEQVACENWRGLGLQSSKRPRHSYLEPSSELLEADYTRLKQVAPIGLMRNGHLGDLKPIKVSPTLSVTLSNTCAFDSLIQLFASAFCDSDTFKQLLLFNSERILTAEIVTVLVRHGITRRIYRLRAEILMKIFSTEENPCGILSLNTVTEVGNLLKKLDFNYCAIESVQCTNCLFLEVKFLYSLEVIVSDDGELNLSDFLDSLKYQPFRKQCSNNNCRGSHQKKIDTSLTHLLIEPLNISSKTFELKTSLDKIPKRIEINDAIYILRGVIGYVGPDYGTGHFICYCFRHNNTWEMFDDRNTKSQPCSSKHYVRAQVLLYTL